MKIRVTDEHIAKGLAGDSELCPVALALKEQTGHPDWWVEPGYLWTEPTFCLDNAFRTPKSVGRFISCFDYDEMTIPKPFAFMLDWKKP